ncbi:RagB/SusD family nutrient uptake outer membrane protein [Xanthocytophaga agilis]|uniref:RagB/SusD family nutrient uptake outer membrane protein n=1 Tax=Xanthocytophaga agilis TaxID=3048010 RepID=A0AAE3REM2_9BACT|nr:RagB/SusD family nutrient uptake outer membrane protein [Xanthocytophaga agilis]MDJ1506798.1 RagB/SusD family nutrient uptake outer membrane protein [Xanthocytophaga agilis]
MASSACSEFLKEDPESLMVAENFYKTEANADAAVVSVYDGLNDQWNIYYRGIYLLAELTTDNAECGQGVANSNIFALNDYTHGPVNDRIYTLYTAVYKSIASANVAIDKIPLIAFNETKKNRLVAEARFVRALLYFNMVRLFSDVPLVLHQVTSLEDVNTPRSPVEEVYAQIIDDLEFAEQNLDKTNTSANLGRATQSSATGLLAKVYLTRKEYQKAKEKATQVLDDTQFGLLESYFDIFTPTNRFNKELIFAIQNKGNTGAANGFGMALFLPRATIKLAGGGTVAGNSADVPTQEFYDSFASGDLRRDRTFFTQYDAGAGVATFRPHWYKFFDPSAITNLGEGTLNYPVIRYSDILLTYAEAINKLEGPTADALEAVNQVRRRAFGKPITQPDASIDLAGLNAETFDEAILQERRWEFGFEDHRWFDLVRTGKLISTMRAKGNTAIQDYHVLFPIPQRERDVNKNLTQNDQYPQ